MKRFNTVFSALFLVFCTLAQAGLKPGDFVASGPPFKKRLALTFDDGPGAETGKFLELLGRYHVRATFFMLGEQAQTRPALARRVAASGHEVGDHTMTHINYLARFKQVVAERGGDEQAKSAAADMVGQELADDMKKSRGAIEKATGVKLDLCRMPHGVDRPWVKRAAKQAGFILVNWTYGADWTKESTASLVSSYLKAIRPGAIFLMHDGESHREKTLTIAEALIKSAKERGYEIVPVGELIGVVPASSLPAGR